MTRNKTKQLVLEDFMPFHLAVVANKVSQSIAKIIDREFNLQIPEWRILTALMVSAPCSSLELVRVTSMDPARVSRAQNRLTDLDLILSEQDKDDKRRLLIQLTPKGKRIAQDIMPEAFSVEEKLLESLSPTEQEALITIMAKLFAATDSLD